ncbi:response regulator [Halieaceae bacterium IMCC14734]|uniref:histidine kinase n=1 Tax=Candidatus Litorirhabdus singularis TaxID=2518993 RepID=A0ABT3TE46_9GAMM|nr:response regulator [Candidatus Litorirhabdus singularis]MCX2980588.1 response regulator [Candidatus Litorirhabdus singularis]
MNDWADIPWDQLQRLFSVVICLDDSMRIVYASETVSRYLPEVKDNPLLCDVFDILRPGKLQTFSDPLASQESLCLMTAISGRFAIRGQLIPTSYDNKPVMCLYGAPWLYWISSNCPDIGVTLSDFAPQDVQLDQLFFMTTEKRMVADLESLNTELTKAKDELQERNNAQHRLFAQMSHEMRTPLNGVVSALSLLEANPLDQTRHHQLISLAQSASHNLMDVINYVLDLSKLELAGEDGEGIFDVLQLVQSSTDILRPIAQEKLLEVTLELAPDIPRHCMGNAPLLRQTLLNLIVNAVKFTDSGSVNIKVQKIAGAGQNCTLKFSVSDTGIGIAENKKQRIFEPFWSLPSSAGSRADAGTGLGLDIVRRNVEHAGGEIGVISELGVGSTFWFDWPTIAQVAEASDSQILPANAVLEPDGELTGKVLLVDDNQTNLLLGRMIIESMGVEVSTATNGTEAVSAALQDNFDLVLMDIHMPDFDGIEATRQIREIKDQRDLPIVALTALAYDKEKAACMEIGMNGYLTKPIVKEALAIELGQWLSRDLASAGAPHNEPQETLAPEEIIDQTVLAELSRQIGTDNLKTVLKKVLTEAEQRWEELLSADIEADKAAMQRQVHSLSSIFRSVGLMPAGDAFAAIELQLRDDSELKTGWIEELKHSKTISLQTLREHLTQL